jgi:hypothetical protein
MLRLGMQLTSEALAGAVDAEALRVHEVAAGRVGQLGVGLAVGTLAEGLSQALGGLLARLAAFASLLNVLEDAVLAAVVAGALVAAREAGELGEARALIGRLDGLGKLGDLRGDGLDLSLAVALLLLHDERLELRRQHVHFVLDRLHGVGRSRTVRRETLHQLGSLAGERLDLLRQIGVGQFHES